MTLLTEITAYRLSLSKIAAASCDHDCLILDTIDRLAALLERTIRTIEAGDRDAIVAEAREERR